MAGLIDKDIRLLMQRKQTLVLAVGLALIIGFTQEGTFILGYLPFLCIIFSISTISYDEMENGYTFLMTLPIDAKTYVREKYLFCIGGGVASWVLAAAIYFASEMIKGNDIEISSAALIAVSVLLTMVIFTVVMIPVQIKFGVEKSRIVMVIMFGIIAGISFLYTRVLGTEAVNNVIAKLEQIEEKDIALGGFLITILVGIISYLICCRIMQNKEL